MAKVKQFKFENTETIYGYIKGKVKWAKVLETSEYDGQDTHNYELNLYPEDMQHWIDKVDTTIKSASEEAVAVGKTVNMEGDHFKVDDEGNKFFKFKMKDTNWEGVPQSPEFYNEFGKKVEDWDALVGNGSTVKVKCNMKPYYMASTKAVGVSFKFTAIQVIDLVEYQAESGFGDESADDAPFDGGETTQGGDF